MTTSTARPSVRRPPPSRIGRRSDASDPPPPATTVSALSRRKTVLLGLGLLALYAGLSLLLSPDAYLSTDVGGKTGALEAMVERGDWSTDLGYWADSSDPTGRAYPYAHTWTTSEGWWVNTTSLPMVLAARPLWALGGAQLILLIPMLSAVGAALVAGRLQHHLDGSDGTWATAAVGLASPLVIYALDFWEHAPGVFLMAGGLLFAVKASERPSLWTGLAAGACFGLAATMRQEALVYGFGAGLVLAFGLLRRWVSMPEAIGRRAGSRTGPRPTRMPLGRCLAATGGMAASALVVLVASSLLEIAYYGESLRSGRSGQAAAAAAGSTDIGERLVAAFTTTLAPINSVGPTVSLLGTALFLCLLWLAHHVERDGELLVPAVASLLIGSVIVFGFVRLGPAFVPGLVPTTSLAVVGLVFGTRRRQLRLMTAMALVPVPLVYATQYTSGAVPQWGGRYLLLTGYVLTVVGCAALAQHRRRFLSALVCVGAVVTAGGVWFASVRTHSVADDIAFVQSVAGGDVVVWYDPILAREAGPVIVEDRWLSTWADNRIEDVVRVLDDRSIDRFVYLDRVDRPLGELPQFDGFMPSSEIGEWETEFLDQRLTLFERK